MLAMAVQVAGMRTASHLSDRLFAQELAGLPRERLVAGAAVPPALRRKPGNTRCWILS